jgi:hypothetical protein
VSEHRKPPPSEYSAFRELLDKIVQVPRAEIEKAEQKYQDEREKLRKTLR